MKGTWVQGKDGREWHQQNATDPTKTIIFVESPKGTFFHQETPPTVKALLDLYMEGDTRLFIDLGDPETGQSWGDVSEAQGTIGRSMGPVKVPLLIKTRRSRGGSAILDHCIVRMKISGKNGRELYRHPTYKPPKVEYPGQARLYADVAGEAPAEPSPEDETELLLNTLLPETA
jgi:hypothetical protein